MEEYLIFFAIGGLLLLTLFINSVAEAYEQKQREKRLKILKIKQGLDEFSEILENLNHCDVSDELRSLIINEIIARLQMIQLIDTHFRGIDALIAEANNNKEVTKKVSNNFIVKDDSDFKTKMVLLRRLIRLCNSTHWYAKISTKALQTYSTELKLLRCEKIFQFYADKAAADNDRGQYLLAREHYYYILHALQNSTISTNSQVVELLEQVNFLMAQTGKIQQQSPASANKDEQAEASVADSQHTPDNVGSAHEARAQ